jgi:pimeloyl-ACP methyl ester carboxylesterase
MDIRAPRPHVVIIGGFLTEPLFFRPMRERLLERGAARVTIASLHWPDWLAMGMAGMGPVMLRGARAIRQARRAAADPVIVVGHSAGGLIARLAMSPEPIDGRYAGVARDVGCLVTLGTPNRFDPVIPGWRHAGVRAAESLERVTPGALGHVVTRVAVGQTPGERGDGLVDEERSRLPGAQHLAFDDVLHGTLGGPWYGDAHIIDRWWPLALEAWREALAARAAGAGATARA